MNVSICMSLPVCYTCLSHASQEPQVQTLPNFLCLPASAPLWWHCDVMDFRFSDAKWSARVSQL